MPPQHLSPEERVHHVTSLDLPELQPYLTLRRPEEHIRQGYFVAEGEKVVRRLLASGLQIVSFLVDEEWFKRLFVDERSEVPSPAHVFVAPTALLHQIVGYNLHQGIMAVGLVPPDAGIAQIPASHLIVALDGLAHAENVGLVARNCTAFGVDALIVGETSCSPYMRRAVRNSMGTVFQLRIIHSQSLVGTLQDIKHTFGTRTIAAHLAEGHPIHDSGLSGNVCIVFGNEDRGVSDQTLSVCDQRVAIPMKTGVDSLNVASASAVFLYEVQRQRVRKLA